MTAYCTYADIVAHTGTELPQATVEALIVDADRRINARLRANGIAPLGTADELVSASIALTKAGLITRLRIDGTGPSSQSVGGASTNDNKDNIVAQLKQEAELSVSAYIAGIKGGDGSEFDPTRADTEMSEFRMG